MENRKRCSILTMNKKRETGFISADFLVYIIACIVNLAIVIGVIYIVMHFVVKYW